MFLNFRCHLDIFSYGEFYAKLYICTARTYCFAFEMSLHHYCRCFALVGCVKKSKLASNLNMNWLSALVWAEHMVSHYG